MKQMTMNENGIKVCVLYCSFVTSDEWSCLEIILFENLFFYSRRSSKDIFLILQIVFLDVEDQNKPKRLM